MTPVPIQSSDAEALKAGFQSTHRVALEERDAPWTPEEVQALDQVVGLLPVPFVSGNPNLRSFVRQREYDGEYQGAPGHGMYRASGGPQAKKDYVVIYDKGLYGPDGAIDIAQLAVTLIHEISHSLDDELPGPFQEWQGLSGWFSENDQWFPARDPGFVNEYARGHPKEDFAESFTLYVLNPERLKQVSPAKFLFMDRLFKQGG